MSSTTLGCIKFRRKNSKDFCFRCCRSLNVAQVEPINADVEHIKIQKKKKMKIKTGKASQKKKTIEKHKKPKHNNYRSPFPTAANRHSLHFSPIFQSQATLSQRGVPASNVDEFTGVSEFMSMSFCCFTHMFTDFPYVLPTVIAV